jgi:putative peptidoglycan lipid II flippase
MVSTWVQPINLVINSRFGSRLYDGAGVSIMEYSTNLYLVIAGTFILSITNVIFPRLSRLTAGGQEGQFRDTLRQTIHSSLFFVLPMTAGLMVVARPLISFIYGGGQFDAFAVEQTSTALVWLSLGMAGYALQNILSRAYFAQQNGRTPLVAGALSIAANILLCTVLVERFSIAGLALSSALSSTVYALLLLLPMERHSEGVLDRGMVLDVIKMTAAALIMGVCAGGVLSLSASLLPAGKVGELMSLGLCALSGLAVYFLLSVVFGLQEAKLSISMFRQLRNRG